jgi:predicted Zn-dependent protease with MMP-like domain
MRDPAKPCVRWLSMDSIRSVLSAAGIAAFCVGLIFVLLHPPSLSGAGGLLAIIAGALAITLIAGLITVRLMGRGSLPEHEIDRMTERSEMLARRPVDAAAETEFELLVAEAMDNLPDEFQQLLETTPVVVSNRGRAEGAYGQYWGGNLTRGDREHRIVLFQDTLERDFGWDRDLLRGQVERTLRHELAHHLGWDEPGVRGLGL